MSENKDCPQNVHFKMAWSLGTKALDVNIAPPTTQAEGQYTH